MDQPLLYDAGGHAIQRMAVPVSSLTQGFLRGDDLDYSPKKIMRPLQQSAWVLSAVKLISNQISGLPLVFTSDKRGGDSMFADPGLTAFWENPAKDKGAVMSRFDVIEACCGWLNLYGEFFWVLDETWLTDRFSRTRSPFYFARPDRMKEVKSDDGELIGWTWTDSRNRIHPLTLEQVIHIKNWNPYNEYRGLAPWLAAKVAANADYISGVFAQNLAANNGSTGEYIVTDGGFPTPEQQNQIIEGLRAKRAAAMRGDFKPAFLPGGLKVESPQVKATDANFVAQRLENRHEIFAAFGVPMSMADITASYSIGSASDRFRLIEDTCMPLAVKICEAIETVSRLYFAGSKQLFAWLDWDDHSVMQQVRRERLAAVDSLWAKGVPLKECSEYLRLGLPEVPGWDVGYLPFSVTPVDQLGQMESMQMGVKEVPEDLIQKAFEVHGISDPLKKALEAPVKKPTIKACECCGDDPDANLGVGLSGIGLSHIPDSTCCDDEPVLADEPFVRSDREENKSKEYFSKRIASIKAYEGKFNRRLIAARVSTLGALGKSVAQAKAIDWSRIKENLADIETKFFGDISRDFEKLHRDNLNKGNAEVMDEIGTDDLEGDPFKIPTDEVQSYVAERQNYIKGTTSDIFDAIKHDINDGISNGLSAQEISDNVRQTFNGISKGRANAIGRTETMTAFNTSRDSAMKRAKVTYKGWLASGIDGRMRPAHKAANGQVVPTDQPFMVGGESLMYPGDSKGSADNVVNCMCVSIALKTDKWPY